jgi:hypothetical protein
MSSESQEFLDFGTCPITDFLLFWHLCLSLVPKGANAKTKRKGGKKWVIV